MHGRVFIIIIGPQAHFTPRSVKHLAQLLSESGYEVTLFATVIPPDLEELRCPGITVLRSRAWSRWYGRLGRGAVPLTWWEAFRLARNRADIVIGIDNVGFPPALAVKWARPGVVFVNHFENLNTTLEQKTSLCLRIIQRWAHKMDLMSSNHEFTLWVRQAWLQTSCPTAVLMNSPLSFVGDPHPVPDSATDARLRLMYQGGIGVLTGFPQLLDAMEMCSDVAHLTIAGSAAAKWEARLRATPGVKYLGALDSASLMEVTSTCDVGIVLYPFRRKGADLGAVFCAPQKLLEYMACGLAVLCSDNLSLREVEWEGWGICVPAEQPHQIAEAIRGLASNREAVKGMSARARDMFEEKYNFRAQAQGFLHTLERICVQAEEANTSC